MDLLNTSLTSVKIEALDSKLGDTLSKLQQSGLFRALVIQSKGNQVLLDTAFGQIKGVVTDKLSKGDEIIARLTPGKTESTLKESSIKVLQIQSAKLELPQKILVQLSQIVGAKPAQIASTSANPNTSHAASLQILKVIGQSSDKTLIQHNNKTWSIPRQNQLQVGESLLLKPSIDGKAELTRIQPETILRAALSRLLPLLASKDTNSLLASQRLASRILQLSPTDLKTPPPQAPVDQADKLAVKIASNNPQSTSVQNQPALKELQLLLNNLSSPLLRLDRLSLDPLKQLLTTLSLSRPTTGTASPGNIPMTDLLARLQAALKNSPDNFEQLLRQIVKANTSPAKTAASDSALMDASLPLKMELLQQLEQSLNQLLTQKTTLRLNQEQNQPIQINLNIPIQLNDETTALKLKIKQRNSSDKDEEQQWEIQLSFEFGLLGLISTHLVLKETRISAHFWAVLPATKQLIDTHLDQFKKQLQKSGFELGQFGCLIGKPLTVEEAAYAQNENLVDINV